MPIDISEHKRNFEPLNIAKNAVYMAGNVSVQHNTIGLIETQYRDYEDIDKGNSIELNYFGIYDKGLTVKEKNNIAVIVANLATAYINKKR